MKTIIPVLLISLVIFSCKKDKEIEPQLEPPVVYDNYSQLKTGNYWIYEIFWKDTLGNLTSMGQFDSCYVEKDTVINDKLFFKMIRPEANSAPLSTFFWRDSLSYIVDSAGAIIFSSKDFSNVLYSRYIQASPGDTVCYYERVMTDNNSIITTPAGTFPTINSQEIYYMYPNWSFAGNPRYRNKRFAKDIGIIEETLHFFVSTPQYQERRLIRYNVN